MTDADKTWECEKVYMGEGTPTAEEFWKIAKEDHPGVQMVMDQKPVNLAGPVKVLSEGDYPTKYAGVYHRPAESRKMFEIAAGAKSPLCSCATPCTAPTNICAKSPWKCVTVFTSTLWSAT
jgi:hypothetical protein